MISPNPPPITATPAATAPTPIPVAAPTIVRDQGCSELKSWTSTGTETTALAPAELASTSQVPDPKPEPGKGEQGRRNDLSKTALDNEKESGSSSAPVNLAERIRARSLEISASAAMVGEAEKAASSGRTARAAELYAANWRAAPDEWRLAVRAVELWSRIGDYMRAEILLKEVEASAASTKDDAALKRVHELDEKLGIRANATTEAARFWRRAFALESEGRYSEGVATLHRLQRFDPTAPGYYVREAALFARCGDAARAGDAIARGSAAGVTYSGRWAPARDPVLLKLWSDQIFASAIRDTLGDAAVEEFEESARPTTPNVQAAR